MPESLYDVPDVSPVDDAHFTIPIDLNPNFIPYIPLLLSAIDAELTRRDVWPADRVDEALGMIEDLKSYIADTFVAPE